MNKTILLSQALSERECDYLLSLSKNVDVMKDYQMNENSDITVNESIDNKTRAVYINANKVSFIHEDLWDSIYSIVYKKFPDDKLFKNAVHMQFITYNVDSYFGYHKDENTSEDVATFIFQLTDNYVGGHFQLDQNVYHLRSGDGIGYNNPQQRWHSVSPIMEGSRVSLAIWFQ